MTKHSPISGIILMLQAAIGFSVMALCVKFASQSLFSLEIVFFRSFIGMLMLLGIMKIKRVPIRGKEYGLMILRGLSGFLALALHFYTIANLPLGTAVMLNYMGPIFASILAIIFLKEQPNPMLFVLTLVSFLGVFLLIGGHLEGSAWMIFLAILSAVFAGIAYVSIRAISHRESPYRIILYFTLVSSVGSLAFVPMGFEWPNGIEWALLVGVGIGSFFGQLWMTQALSRAPASLVSPFFYLTPLLSFLYGAAFFGEMITPTSLIGALLIILSGSLISYFEANKKAIKN
jgi:drug/metabolite transporter (DMT)-like permease